MAQVVDLPLEDGGMLLVQPTAADEPSGGFGLASSAEEKAGETLESAMTSAEEAQSLPEESATVQAGQAECRHEPALVSPAFVSESPRTRKQQTPRTTPRSNDSPPDPPVPSARVLAPTVYRSPTAGSMVTGSSQANARRWGSRHRPGPCVSASSSQTGTFA